MIARRDGAEANLAVECRETGRGPTVVFAPGSCSTGAAWRLVLEHLPHVRAVTTSLSGYGGTAERRTSADRSIAPVAQALEDVIDRAGGPVHLVGHSFGGLTALAVALRGRAPLLSLTVLEAPAPRALTGSANREALEQFHSMTKGYIAAHEAGRADAIGIMIDFYGGSGTWAAMPEQVRFYVKATTAVNMLDWGAAYGLELDKALRTLGGLRTVIAVGALSHPAVVRANELVAERIPHASFERIGGAAHFMIATHPTQVAGIVTRQLG